MEEKKERKNDELRGFVISWTAQILNLNFSVAILLQGSCSNYDVDMVIFGPSVWVHFWEGAMTLEKASCSFSKMQNLYDAS